MSKTCLIQAATGANTWNGLGNGRSGPSLLIATETQTSCTNPVVLLNHD